MCSLLGDHAAHRIIQCLGYMYINKMAYQGLRGLNQNRLEILIQGTAEIDNLIGQQIRQIDRLVYNVSHKLCVRYSATTPRIELFNASVTCTSTKWPIKASGA